MSPLAPSPELKELTFGTKIKGHKNSNFVVVTAQAQLYHHYEDPCVTEDNRDTWFKVALMVQRWDGRLGFPGGFGEEGETLEEGALRELHEEVGFVPADNLTLSPLCSHSYKNSVLHCFHLDLGKVTYGYLQNVLLKAAVAKHAIIEGTATWVHLQDYGNGKGINNLLSGYNLCGGVKEELLEVLKKLNINNIATTVEAKQKQ